MRSKKKSGPDKKVPSRGFGKADTVISRRNQNGTVILMRLDKSSSFYKIDGIAAEVWASFEAPKSLESVMEFFSQRYPSKAKTMSKDIEGLIKKLVKLDLLAQSSGPFAAGVSSPAGSGKKPSDFGGVQEFDLEQIETEVLNESVYLDVFAGSDFLIKTEIKPIQDALNKVVQLEGITHRWTNKRKGVHAGLIAQQVAEQMPELVRRDRGTGVLAVNYQKFNSYLVEAIKDLNYIRLQQEKRIRKLEKLLA